MAKLFVLQTIVFIIKIIHSIIWLDTVILNIKQQNKLFCTAKNSWTRMSSEVRPIEFTKGPFLQEEKGGKFK